MRPLSTQVPLEIPERTVLHDFDGEEFASGELVGEAQTLPMDAVARAQARKRRARLDELGGFGFGRAS
jgi:hypothetical protein